MPTKLTPRSTAISASALISIVIMFFACSKSSGQDNLTYAVFGILLFAIDVLLCTSSVYSKHSAVTAVALVFANTTGVALMLVDNISALKLLFILTIASVSAVLFCRFMPAVSQKCMSTKRNGNISLGVITGLTIMLYLVLFLFPKLNGARVWITVGPISLQVSEITKLLFLIALTLIIISPFLSIKRRFAYGLTLLSINVLFLMLHNELGTAFVMLIVFTVVVFVFFPMRYGIITLFSVITLLVLSVMIVKSAYVHFQASEADNIVVTLVNKVYTRLYPENTYQTDIALQGFINGGLFGADPAYVLDIPVSESDFAVAQLNQRFGLVVSILYIVSLISVIFTIYKYSSSSKRLNRNYILSFIFAVTMIIQSCIVVFTNAGWIPVMGINSAFISYGGTQCVLNYIMAAVIVRSLSDKKAKPPKRHMKREELFKV